jgi:hypothetical protein
MALASTRQDEPRPQRTLQPRDAPPPREAFWDYFAPTVKPRIDGTTDCDELQAEFDNAYAGHERATAVEDLDRMRAQSDLMDYVYDRAERLGCYG